MKPSTVTLIEWISMRWGSTSRSLVRPGLLAGTVVSMASADDPPARSTAAQRAQEKREQKLADVQKEIDSGRMTRRQLTPEEMAEHAERREEVQAQRRKRSS